MDQQNKDNAPGLLEKFSGILSLISLGKYDTKLYYSKNGLAQKSSRFGGILTIITVIILISFGLATFIDIVYQNKQNLNITAREVYFLKIKTEGDSPIMSNKTQECNSTKCESVKNKDVLPNLLNGLNFVVRYD